MNTVVICYLYGSLLLYLVTGGADFGAGVVELLTPASGKKHIRGLMRRQVAAIWEADHMWLILAIVILFVGFPDIYAEISTTLYIPMTILLFGIVGRGTSYAFRNGDPGYDRFKNTDNIIYIGSSVITPFFLGVIVSAVFSGSKSGSHTFSDVYIYNWLNYFSFSVGLLTVVLCGYLAMIYTLSRFPAERHSLRGQFLLLSFLLLTSVPQVVYTPVFARILPGGISGLSISTALVVLTAVILYLMWRLVFSKHGKWARIFALLPILFTVSILVCAHDFTAGGGANADIRKTTDVLGWILVIASCLIIPALGYLLYTFELARNEQEQRAK